MAHDADAEFAMLVYPIVQHTSIAAKIVGLPCVLRAFLHLHDVQRMVMPVSAL